MINKSALSRTSCLIFVIEYSHFLRIYPSLYATAASNAVIRTTSIDERKERKKFSSTRIISIILRNELWLLTVMRDSPWS